MIIPNSMKQLNILQKFCDNKMDFNNFIKVKKIVDNSYALEKWNEFKIRKFHP